MHVGQVAILKQLKRFRADLAHRRTIDKIVDMIQRHRMPRRHRRVQTGPAFGFDKQAMGSIPEPRRHARGHATPAHRQDHVIGQTAQLRLNLNSQ